MHKDSSETTRNADSKAQRTHPNGAEAMKMRGVFIGNKPPEFHRVWTPDHRARLAEWVELPDNVWSDTDLLTHRSYLREVEVAFATWGMPKLTSRELDMMPGLRILFYAGGTTKRFAETLLKRDIKIVSAWAANAVPVAEYALSQILFGLKLGWSHVRMLKQAPAPESFVHLEMPGAYGATVGIVSLGMVGRKLCEFLQPFHVRKIAYDPLVDEEVFASLGATSCSLEEIFARSEVVSLHAPWLRETEGLITGEMIASMKPHATLINTARGAVIREPAMIEVLQDRPDLTAILDVTHPEPPPSGSALYRLPNVILTPHIAGSAGMEVRRMADLIIEEFHSWRAGEPLRYEVTADLLAVAA